MANYIPNLEDTRLEKNRHGVWAIVYTEPAGSTGTGRARTRSYSCRTTDRRIAEIVREEWVNAGHHMATHTTRQTVGGLITLYIRDHVDANGIRESQKDALKPVNDLLGHLDVADLSPTYATDYRRVRSARVKDATIRRELGALRRVLTWSHENQHWPVQLMIPHIPLPPDSKPKKTYIVASKEAQVFAQAEQDFTAANLADRVRIALFTMIALDTAARAEAIETLTLDRIDLVQGYIDFRDPTRADTKKRRSIVPIADRLLPVLKVAVTRAKAQGWDYLLGTTGSTEKLWRRYRVRLGIPTITRHDLRRTFATLAMQQGADIWEVAGVLADTVQTTERSYAHHAPAFLKGAINKRRGNNTEPN